MQARLRGAPPEVTDVRKISHKKLFVWGSRSPGLWLIVPYECRCNRAFVQNGFVMMMRTRQCPVHTKDVG